MYQHYDEKTANLQDRVAWALCQILDDDAPANWPTYRFAGSLIAKNTRLMADLRELETSEETTGRQVFQVSAAEELTAEKTGEGGEATWKVLLDGHWIEFAPVLGGALLGVEAGSSLHRSKDGDYLVILPPGHMVVPVDSEPSEPDKSFGS